jgi:thiol-disulfide isomerase/thioredoxin
MHHTTNTLRNALSDRPRHIATESPVARIYRGGQLRAAWLLGLLLSVAAHATELETYTQVRAPTFELPGLDDRTHALSDYRGRVVLLNFWASWCPPCIYEMPKLVSLQKRLADKPFVILAINVGEKKYKVGKFSKLIELDLPVLLDTSKNVFRAWGLETLPTSFVIDADGRMRYRAYGDPGWDEDHVVSVMDELITEATRKPAARPATDHTTEADR